MPAHSFDLTVSEEKSLRELLNRTGVTANAKTATRILLALSRPGGSYNSVTKSLFVSRDAIARAVRAFEDNGVLGVMDIQARWGRPPLPQEQRDKIIKMAAQSPPPRARDIAKSVGCSVGSISNTLKAARRSKGQIS